MKRINSPVRNILISLIFLTAINQVIFADPYIALCLGINCQYLQAASQTGMCSVGDYPTRDLYATVPGSMFPCYGTRQWYTFVFGWVCVGNICRQGWYPQAIEGATENKYTVAAKGKYWCTVDCGGGAYNTDTVEFFYDSDTPTINSHPQNLNTCEGTTATFNAAAYSGSGYIKYNWQKMIPGGSFTTISDATLSSYSYTPPAGDDLSLFRCKVSNGCGSNYSNEATLDIKFEPTITKDPSDASVCSGTSSNFSVSTSGDDLTYQWQLSSNSGTDWGNIYTSGQYSINNDQISVSDITSNMSGYKYRCMVSGYCPPSVASSGATLTVKTKPEITSSPVNIEKCAGDAATFKVQANGTAPMEYYWRKDEGSGSWTSSSEYNIPAVSISDEGSYDVLIKNECYESGVESNNATLTVHGLPAVNLGADKYICEGSDLVLDAGAGLTLYSWSTGETTRTITVNEQAGYSVTVTDNKNCVNSDNIMVFLDTKIPSLNLGDDIKICLKQSVDLDAGSIYDNYLWNTGAITQSVAITETGDYSVQVSNNGNVCIESDEIHVLVAEPYDGEKIGVVTFDPTEGKNLLVWEKTPDKGTQSYNIYKVLPDSNILLGSIAYGELTVFTDVTSNPRKESDRYVITVVDTCSNESFYSASHKTMHLTANRGTSGEVNLIWEHYEGIPVNRYYIFRGTDTTAMTIMDSINYDISKTTYTDLNPPAYTVYYQIGVKLPKVIDLSQGKKADSGPYSHSMSNIEDNRFQTGLSILNSAGELAIYPNPATDYVTIRFSNPGQKGFQLTVRDLTGKMVLIINNITEDKVTIERGRLKAGYYLVEVNGEYIYRGKLILE